MTTLRRFAITLVLVGGLAACNVSITGLGQHNPDPGQHNPDPGQHNPDPGQHNPDPGQHNPDPGQ
jgi:hypothetical protein